MRGPSGAADPGRSTAGASGIGIGLRAARPRPSRGSPLRDPASASVSAGASGRTRANPAETDPDASRPGRISAPPPARTSPASGVPPKVSDRSGSGSERTRAAAPATRRRTRAAPRARLDGARYRHRPIDIALTGGRADRLGRRRRGGLGHAPERRRRQPPPARAANRRHGAPTTAGGTPAAPDDRRRRASRTGAGRRIRAGACATRRASGWRPGPGPAPTCSGR